MDGWKESDVRYSFTLMCNQPRDSVQLDMMLQKHISPVVNVPDSSVLNALCMEQQYQNARFIERMRMCSEQAASQVNLAISQPDCPANSQKKYRHDGTFSYYCVCSDGYYNYRNQNTSGSQGFCSAGATPLTAEERWLNMQTAIRQATQPVALQPAPYFEKPSGASVSATQVVTNTQQFTDISCADGFVYNQALARCESAAVACTNRRGIFSELATASDGQVACTCKTGYQSQIGGGVCTAVATTSILDDILADRLQPAAISEAETQGGQSGGWILLFTLITLSAGMLMMLSIGTRAVTKE